MIKFSSMTEALVACDTEELDRLVDEAIAGNIPAGDILKKGIIAGMDVVGKKTPRSSGKPFMNSNNGPVALLDLFLTRCEV